MVGTPVQKALSRISESNDPNSLRQIAANAWGKGEMEVVRAAELRLFEILPSEKPGTLEHDVWRSIYALEATLSSERGKTVRLSRTRPKIARVGEVQTLSELIVASKPSDGFFMLIERGMTEYTFEAVALRHQERFDVSVISAATARLQEMTQQGSAAN